MVTKENIKAMFKERFPEAADILSSGRYKVPSNIREARIRGVAEGLWTGWKEALGKSSEEKSFSK